MLDKKHAAQNIERAKRSKVSDTLIRKIVRAVIINQMALDTNEDIKHTVYYKQTLKNRLNALIKELIKTEKEDFESFIESVEQQTDTVYNVLYLLISEIEDLDFPDYADVVRMIRAFKKDKKSIIGIVKKIL